jgi:hypothetical protein
VALPDETTYLFLLTEDDSDDQIIVFLLEMMTARRFEVTTTKMRRGGGVGEVRRKLPLVLAAIRRMGIVEGAAFTVVLDNDRALQHPGHLVEPHHGPDVRCRHCELRDALDRCLPDGWPIPGAIAIPVQMIEAWLLLLHDKTKYPLESGLPLCARRDQPIAVRHYGAAPPPQLKDLVDLERAATAKNRHDFALGCALALDMQDLAARSPSFALFAKQVLAWR